MGFGLVGLVAVLRFFIPGWIAHLCINPSYHFGYLGAGSSLGWAGVCMPTSPRWGCSAFASQWGIVTG